MPPPSAIQGDGSVQQGLSAAYESIAFCKHRRAADKRYSLGVIAGALFLAAITKSSAAQVGFRLAAVLKKFLASGMMQYGRIM